MDTAEQIAISDSKTESKEEARPEKILILNEYYPYEMIGEIRSLDLVLDVLKNDVKTLLENLNGQYLKEDPDPPVPIQYKKSQADCHQKDTSSPPVKLSAPDLWQQYINAKPLLREFSTTELCPDMLDSYLDFFRGFQIHLLNRWCRICEMLQRPDLKICQNSYQE